MKSRILLIFSIFIFSFNVFSTPNSNEKFKLAKSYLEQKEYVKAEKIYLELAKKKDVHAIYNLGYLYMEQGKIIEGEKYYKMAADMGYDDAMFNLAMFYDRQKNYDKEKFYLEKLAAKNQNDAIFQLAIIYRQEGNYQKADEFYKRLLKEKYQESEVFYNLGISCYYQKKYDEAEKYFLKAIELGNNDDPEYNLGILYKVQGKFAQAKKYLIPLAQKGKVDAMINVGAISIEMKKIIAMLKSIIKWQWIEVHEKRKQNIILY